MITAEERMWYSAHYRFRLWEVGIRRLLLSYVESANLSPNDLPAMTKLLLDIFSNVLVSFYKEETLIYC